MSKPFGYCLNTATIRGHSLGIVAEVELAAKAGYEAIEPWIESIAAYRQGGGSLRDLRKRIADLGLKVPGAIGFAQWLADQKARRRRALEQAKREMGLVRQIGGTGMAAPPAGMIKRRGLDPFVAAELGYIDDVFEPRFTRPRLITALSVMGTKVDRNPPRKHGNIPL